MPFRQAPARFTLAAVAAAASLLGACTQSGAPPAQASAVPAAPAPSSGTQTPQPPTAAAPTNPQQNATLSELLANSPQQPANATAPAEAAPNAVAPVQSDAVAEATAPPTGGAAGSTEYATVVSVKKIDG